MDLRLTKKRDDDTIIFLSQFILTIDRCIYTGFSGVGLHLAWFLEVAEKLTWHGIVYEGHWAYTVVAFAFALRAGFHYKSVLLSLIPIKLIWLAICSHTWPILDVSVIYIRHFPVSNV